MSNKIKKQSSGKIYVQVLGRVLLLFSACWITFCFLLINIEGKAMLAIEPNVFLAFSELLLYFAIVAFGFYLVIDYFRSLERKKTVNQRTIKVKLTTVKPKTK